MSSDLSGKQGDDHLSVLPLEILYIIFDYLFPTHDPPFNPSSFITQPPPPRNPVYYLSITSRTLNITAQSWATSFLRHHAAITGYKALSDHKKQNARNFLSGPRGSVLSWSRNHCVFCGKSSTRSATLMNGFRCCMKCDREQWPDKITRSEAKAVFGLKDQHLPTSFDKEPCSKLRLLRFGKYISYGTLTTMYLRPDVKALAEKVHGDLQAYLNKKDAAKAEKLKKLVAPVARAPIRERKRRRRGRH